MIAQSHVFGPLAMVQAIADGGRLVAYHACLRLREGVGGGASLKQSIALPGLADMLARLVAALDWHGALSMDLIVGDSGPVIIDLNPRLVEPANALAAGVDLVAAMLDIARDARSSGGMGVRTRQTLLAILGAAEHQGTRGAAVREALDAVFAQGDYTGSTEELTPVKGDPVVAALVASLIHPPLWRKVHTGAVGPYAVTPEAWNRTLAAAE